MGRKLNPDVNIWALAQPLVEDWMRDNLGPAARLQDGLARAAATLDRLPDLIDGLIVRKCTFVQCQNPLQRTAEDRPILRNVEVTRCHFEASDLASVIAEECTIDTVWFHRGNWGPQSIAGCAFRHVTVKGNITGSVRFLPSHQWLGASPARAFMDDPLVLANKDYYESRARAYDARLDETKQQVQAIINEIPADSRKLVTNHDALEYFTNAFGLKVVGAVIPSVSTDAEPSAKDTAALIDLIRKEKVKAIFAESSVNPAP